MSLSPHPWPAVQVCQAFARYHDPITTALKAAGKTVTLNVLPAEGRKPDIGSFIIVAGGKPVISLKSLPRPFTALKALKVEDIVSQVLAAL